MRLTVAVAALVLALAACGDDATGGATEPEPAPAPDLMTELDGRSFVADEVSDPDHTLVPGSKVTLTFDGGRLVATAGCNRIFAGAQVRDAVLEVDKVGGTMMACAPALMAQEHWLVALLEGSPRLELQDDVLTLTRGRTAVTMNELKAPGPAPAEGTRWVLDSITSGSGEDSSISSVPAGADAWLEVHDGTLQLSTGCNRGRGEVTVTPTSWTVGALAITRKACVDDDLASVERAMLNVLDGHLDATVDGNRLRLTTRDQTSTPADGKTTALTFRASPQG